MKKVLLSMVALLMSTFTFAQVNGALKLERNAAPAKMAVKASPRKALADGQRYLGYYSSDNYGLTGLGIAPLGAYETCKAVTAMSTDFLKPFVGMKVVGIRYAILAPNLVAKVMLGECEFTNQGVGFGDALLSKDVTSSNAGWNTVMFDAPYTIPANAALYAGFQYNQKAVKQGNGFTDECYPLSLIKEGVTGNPLYIYTNVPANKGGNGEGWYNFGSEFGNICIQLIVEGQPAGNFLTPVQLDEFQTVVGKTKNVEVLFQNVCKNALSSYSYTYTQNGVTSGEQTVDLAANTTETIVKLPVQIEGASAAGNHDFTLNITKVNYGENAAAVTSIKGKNETMAKELKPVVLMEEQTGTGCGWCPRAMQGINKAAEKFGDQFISIAIHHFNASDPMYTINYANLGFGEGAPLCKLNRVTAAIDPYYGTSEDICDDIAALLTKIPEAAVTVKAEWGAADDGKLTATATVEAQAAKTYQLAFAVIADNVKGENDNWIQSNYYSSAYSGNTGLTYNAIEDDLKFLWNEYPYKPVFNDVLVAGSYVRTLNKCANVDVPAEGTVEGSYEITMPVTNTKLLPALDKDQLYIVGFIIDPTTKTVVNAAKAKIPTWVTGINGVKANGENAVEVARYTMDGRQVSAPVKGINLVKMSDGTTQKVLVK